MEGSTPLDVDDGNGAGNIHDASFPAEERGGKDMEMEVVDRVEGWDVEDVSVGVDGIVGIDGIGRSCSPSGKESLADKMHVVHQRTMVGGKVVDGSDVGAGDNEHVFLALRRPCVKDSDLFIAVEDGRDVIVSKCSADLPAMVPFAHLGLVDNVAKHARLCPVVVDSHSL